MQRMLCALLIVALLSGCTTTYQWRDVPNPDGTTSRQQVPEESVDWSLVGTIAGGVLLLLGAFAAGAAAAYSPPPPAVVVVPSGSAVIVVPR